MGIFSVKKEITPDTIIQRESGLLFNEIDGEVVMLSIENSEYYGMNEIGSQIWLMIEKPISLHDLLNNLISEFEISYIKCKEDTLEFLDLLIIKKLISIS